MAHSKFMLKLNKDQAEKLKFLTAVLGVSESEAVLKAIVSTHSLCKQIIIDQAKKESLSGQAKDENTEDIGDGAPGASQSAGDHS
jgi:hypothetical protein